MRSEILFITRTFPPAVGGMQAYSYHLHERLCRHHRVHRIALSRSARHLAWFVPYAIGRGLATTLTRDVTHIYVGDAVMAPVGLLVRLARPSARTAVTVHGLDLTYPNRLYQAMVRLCLPRFDRVVSNSHATAEVAYSKGVSPSHTRVIPCGVVPPDRTIPRDQARLQLRGALGHPLHDRTIIVTVGRLVRRKGVAWFIEQVVPRLPPEALYVVIGDGPDEHAVRSAAEPHSGRVVLMGRASDEVRDTLLDAADVLVMPNILIPGDMEGFGIVALEAAVRGLPVVASRMEGIVDAVIDGVSGLLVPPEDPDAFARAVDRARGMDRSRIARAVLERCDWDVVYRQYADFLELDGHEGP